MKRGTPNHPKMLALKIALNIPFPFAVGIMESLWHFTAARTPRGNIGKWDNHMIALSVGWEEDVDELISALLKAGWLEEHPEFRLVVHDWSDHAEDSVHKWLADNNLLFWNGQKPRRKSRQVATNRDKSRQVASAYSHSHSHSQLSPCSPSRESGEHLNGEGDEVWRILRTAPALSTLTYEQDLKARNLAKIKGPGTPDWLIDLAKKVVDEAIVMGSLDHPGAWWRKKLENFVKNKKNMPPKRSIYVPLADRKDGEE